MRCDSEGPGVFFLAHRPPAAGEFQFPLALPPAPAGQQEAIMRRFLVVLAMSALVCTAAAQQSGGLSPKAGAFSEDLYTNLYFGFNVKTPAKWKVNFVASDGPCGNECLLLDVRNPNYPKSLQVMQVTAEMAKPQVTLREAAAGASLVQMGAKKVSEPKELSAGGATLYRTDYRSQLANGDLFQALLLLPGKEYATVFTFASGNRRELDNLVDDFAKAFSKMGQ